MAAWLGRNPLTGGRFLLVSSYGGKGKGAVWGFFYKSPNSINEGSSLMANHPPRASPPNAITLDVRIPTCEF